jgi:hypothetical protein
MRHGIRVGSILLLAGCAGFYDEITLHADGSGTYQLTVIARDSDPQISLETLRPAFRAEAERLAKEAGFQLQEIEVRREGRLLVVRARAGFRSLSVFAHPSLGVSPDARRWSFVTPRVITFEGGRFEANVLRDSAPGKGRRGSLAGHEGRFTVYLPGDVVSTNGEAREHSASWSVPLERLCDEPVTMTATARVRPWLWAWALAALLLGGLAASVYGFFFRGRKAA